MKTKFVLSGKTSAVERITRMRDDRLGIKTDHMFLYGVESLSFEDTEPNGLERYVDLVYCKNDKLMIVSLMYNHTFNSIDIMISMTNEDLPEVNKWGFKEDVGMYPFDISPLANVLGPTNNLYALCTSVDQNMFFNKNNIEDCCDYIEKLYFG